MPEDEFPGFALPLWRPSFYQLLKLGKFAPCHKVLLNRHIDMAAQVQNTKELVCTAADVQNQNFISAVFANQIKSCSHSEIKYLLHPPVIPQAADNPFFP